MSNKKIKRRKALCLNSAENLDSNYENQVNRNVPKELTLYIPENLDIDKLLSEKPPNFDFPWYRDCFVYLLHLINDIPSRNKELTNEYTQIYSLLVQPRIYHYKKYLNYLEKHNVILSQQGYSTLFGKSKGYAFCDKYETPVRPMNITKKTLIKSIIKFIDLDNIGSESSGNTEPFINRDLSYLTKRLNKHLTIDFVSATNYLLNEYEKDLKKKVKKRIANRKLCSRMLVVHRIHKGDFQFTIDNNAGRLYTVLTQIKKELRQFIRYNGKKLVAIDIKNSQPYLSSVLFSEEHYNLNNCEKAIQYYNPLFRIEENYTNFKNKLSEARKMKDIPAFLSIISKGEIYEYFGTELQNNSILDKNLNSIEIRNKAKKILMNLLFGENDYKYFYEYASVLRKVFPTVYDTFYFIKYNKHNSLACFLQNLEANLVLDIACKIISEERPELEIFTIHDSIVTTEGNEEYVEGVLHNVLYKHIGLPPKLKIEKWGNSLID